MSRIVILSGPTASGKSRLGCELAKLRNGVIINCDSKQLYKEIPIITAQPTEEERQSIPHYLYGVISVTEHCSVARWVEMVKPIIDNALAEGKLPILVGGTGMYIQALIYGISPIPDSDPAIRQQARALFNEIGNEAFHQRLASLDPIMAERLNPGDTQRILRAYEIITQTGKSLSEWQKISPTPLYPFESFIHMFLNPPREQIYVNCNKRFLAMMEGGVMEEMQALDAMKLDPLLPSMKSHGVPELLAYLHGTMTREEAITQAQANTRHYVKRQLTWFHNQMREAQEITTLEQAVAILGR